MRLRNQKSKIKMGIQNSKRNWDKYKLWFVLPGDSKSAKFDACPPAREPGGQLGFERVRENWKFFRVVYFNLKS
ncbi:hypothetical protein DRQ11_00180 [candidate division KSB1 bacterium]|nr:MAG: hypothetical protein DRQ11_00180 [candidate division KSB1 bacterium]